MNLKPLLQPFKRWDLTVSWHEVITLFFNPSLFQKTCSVRNKWNAKILHERWDGHYRNQYKLQLSPPLSLAPGRPDCHLENECLRRVKRSSGEVAGVTSQAQLGDWVQCKKTYAKPAQVNRTGEALEMIAGGSYHAHSTNRIEVDLSQIFAVTCRDRLACTVVYLNNTVWNNLVFFGNWLLFLILFQINSRKRGTKITFPWPGAEPCWRGPLKV